MPRAFFRAICTIAIAMVGFASAQARFLQTDPIGYEGGKNLYAYVENDPINQLDPDGKKPESVWDQMYLYPKLTPEQREGIEEQHRQIGENAATGVIAGTTLTLPSGAILRGAQAYRAFYVTTNVKTGLTIFQTRSITNFFGKGLAGAERAMARIGEKGFQLPKGVTSTTLEKYKAVAERAIAAGKTPEVQRARIEVIDETLKKIKN